MNINTLETNHLIRSLRICLITEQPNPIIKWFNSIWNKVLVIELEVFHSKSNEFIYYYSDDDGKKQWLFYKDNNDDSGTFYVNDSYIWKFLEENFNIENVDIENVIKTLVEYSLHCEISIPLPVHITSYAEEKITRAIRKLDNSLAQLKHN